MSPPAHLPPNCNGASQQRRTESLGCSVSNHSRFYYLRSHFDLSRKGQTKMLLFSRGGRMIFVFGGGQAPRDPKVPPIQNRKLGEFGTKGRKFFHRARTIKNENKLFASLRGPVPDLKRSIPRRKGPILGPEGPIPGLTGPIPGLRRPMSGLKRTIQS